MRQTFQEAGGAGWGAAESKREEAANRVVGAKLEHAACHSKQLRLISRAMQSH